MAYVWSNSMSLFFSAPSNVSTIIHILYLPEDAKGENVHFQWKQDYLHAGEVYEACWALDNILIINAAHRKVVLEDNLDPVDTGNWLFFPGATVKVSLNISEEFLNMFADDYVFTVSNGIGGVIYVKKEDLSSIYLSIPDGSTSIKIVAKVTEKDSGRDIETVYTVTKPDAEGLQGGDSFNVTVKPVEEGEDPNNPDVTPSDPKLGIQLDIDLTMDETGITVKVPTELIEESKPDEPDQPTDPDQPTVDGPEIIGADEVVEVDTNNPPTVQVTMKAPAGIQNLLVTITSDSNEFIGLISQMGLGETFDLANPGDLEDKLGGSLEDGSGIGLIDPNDPIKDKKEFIFDVSGFMPMLSPFGLQQHYFTIKLIDNNGKELAKKLTVKVVKN